METMDIEPTQPTVDPRRNVINCTVHWGKQSFNVEADLDESLIVLKAQLFYCTQVDPQRQKIIYRGRILKDETWPVKTLVEGSHLRMVGTNEVVVIPELTDDEPVKPKNIPKLPPCGLRNFGNTCYMNSVLQIVRVIPELKEAIVKNEAKVGENGLNFAECTLINSMAELIKGLDQRSETCEDLNHKFIKSVETCFPEYASSHEGLRQQQDANEFFVRLLGVLKKHINVQTNQYEQTRNIVDTFFGIEMDKTFQCLEVNGDAPATVSETHYQLSCFISETTKFMLDGIKSKLSEKINKHSEVLSREAEFSINTFITRFPSYVCVEFVRFFYKEKEKVNAKIMKDVKFPLRLDLSDLCSSQLKERLKPMQKLVRVFESKLSLGTDASPQSSSMKSLNKQLESGFFSLPDQKMAFGDSGSAIYQLIAVITHEGSYTLSGHYIAWIRLEPSRWAKLDDFNVSLVEESEILKLSGGGRSHSAYLLVYQAVKLPKR